MMALARRPRHGRGRGEDLEDGRIDPQIWRSGRGSWMMAASFQDVAALDPGQFLLQFYSSGWFGGDCCGQSRWAKPFFYSSLSLSLSLSSSRLCCVLQTVKPKSPYPISLPGPDLTPGLQLRRRSMERKPPSLDSAAEASAVALVLGNDDLLIETLVRLDSPTCLVRAAAVCRCWLRRASDPAFLRRFRALHPPRILGLHVKSGCSQPRFLALRQPQELAAAARRAVRVLSLSRGTPGLWDCRNDRLLVEFSDCPGNFYAVRSLLNHHVPDVPFPAPPAPSSIIIRGGGVCRKHMLLLEDDDDVTSCLSLILAAFESEVRADFAILQSGVWGVRHSAVAQFKTKVFESQILRLQKLVVGRKVYMQTYRFILGLDLDTDSFFTVKLPDGVVNYTLSRTQQSGLYLIDAKEFQLHVWHGDGAGQWDLVDTISVREACGDINVPRWEPDDGDLPVLVFEAGDNAEFVFLQLRASGIICCMQLGNRIAERLNCGTIRPRYNDFMHPISMVWPPIFPKLDEANGE